jgi:hypothetical protein
MTSTAEVPVVIATPVAYAAPIRASIDSLQNYDSFLIKQQASLFEMVSNPLTAIPGGNETQIWRYEIEHCNIVAEGSKKRYNEAHGIMYGVVTADELALCFYSVENNTSSNNKTDGKLIDEFLLQKNNNHR